MLTRRLQSFSLRALVAFWVCLTILIAVVAIRARSVRAQVRTFEEIRAICNDGRNFALTAEQKGAKQGTLDYLVGYFPQYEIVSIGIFSKEKLQAAESALSKSSGLKSVNFALSNIDDDALKTVPHCCPAIRALNLSYSVVTDQCIVSLSHLTALQALEAEETALTGKGFSLIGQRCPGLSSLNLNGSALTSDGLREIADHCQSLTAIDISRTNLDPIDLILLSKLVKLKEVRAVGIDVPEYIHEELSFLLPSTDLMYDVVP